MAAIKSFFSDTSIMKKALVGPLVMLIFMIASGAFALTSLSSVGERMRYASLELTPDTGAATDLMSAMFRERLAAEAFLANNTQQRFDKWQAVHADTSAAATLAVKRFAGSSRAETVERAIKLQQEYARTFADEVAPRRLEIVSIRNETLDPRSDEATELLRFVGNVVPELQARTGRILQQIVQTQLAVERFLRTAEQKDEEHARDLMAQVKLDIDMAAATANGMTGSSDNDFLPDAIEQSKVAAEAWAAYVDAFDRAAKLTHAARAATEGAMSSAGPAMTDAARELHRSIFDELAELGTRTTEETGSTLLLLVGVLVAAAAVGLAVAVIVTRGVVRPLLLTNQRIDTMLREIDAGHGDLTQRLPVNSRDEVGQLAGNFNRFVETLQKVVGRIGEETNRLAGAAAKLSAVTSQTSSGVQRQNSETDQVATAMTQMTATVQEIARNASEASVAAADANQSASQGRRTVEATVDAIQELVDLMENGAGTVTRVSEDVEAITSIVDVIRGIAEQTNLLALNAAIEAARAGEQGRGFAVVADEVRDLAQKTQSSTGRIQALIENLQNGARSAVDAMNEGCSQGQRTVGHAAEAGEALQRIDCKVQVINDMNAQIASAAEEQTAVSNDITASVERIRQIATETGGGAGETASSSEELAHLGERLKTLVGQFRV